MATVSTSAPLQGQWQHHVPLAPYTSWRVGGPADHLYRPAHRADLVAFLQQLPPEEPLTWLGLGSNTLVRDGGIRGTVVVTQGALKALELREADCVYAEAGVSCAQLARFAARRGLVGGEFLAGIPGTVGGALAMNAGAFGGETWRWVQAVDSVDRHGQVHHRRPQEYQVGYREVRGVQEAWFLAGYFRFERGDAQQALVHIREHLAQRNTTQPTNVPSGGSVFRNPPGDYAARLIEACGLKGYTLGGAQVSSRHANFIVNTGKATAAHIEDLIARVQQRVWEQHGVRLVVEVHMLGEGAKNSA